jgi:outer membrane murein-binding lipoprotein Lpp
VDGWDDDDDDPGDDLISINEETTTSTPPPLKTDHHSRQAQEVDPNALSQLVDMGFSKNGCTRALLAVGGSNVEAATNWIFDHSMDSNFNDDPFPDTNHGTNSSSIPEPEITAKEQQDLKDHKQEAILLQHKQQIDSTILSTSSDDTVCVTIQSHEINKDTKSDTSTRVIANTATTTSSQDKLKDTIIHSESLEDSVLIDPTVTVPTCNNNIMEQEDVAESTHKQQQHILPELKGPPMSTAVMNDEQINYNNRHQNEINELKALLQKQNDQLQNVNKQLSETLVEHEKQIREYQGKIESTKEEAKKRIQRAKERAEEIQARMGQLESTNKATADTNYQLLEQQLLKEKQISAELREEGEALALKQSSMEQLVRAARTEARDFSDKLLTEQDKVKKLNEKLDDAQKKNKANEKDLEVAKRGAEMAKKLENELMKEKSENQTLASIKMSLEQQVVDLKRGLKEALKDAEQAMISQGKEGELLSLKLRKEHEQVLADLEEKLKRAEREAHIREESLRQEIQDLRKRWQDAIRRADSLSMDLQESTAPLLRQIQSAEKQARVRSAAWAEVETKLRSDLESSLMEHDKISKERSELSMTIRKIERSLNEKCEELSKSQDKIDKLSLEIERLNEELDNLEAEKEDLLQQKKFASEEMSRAKTELLKNAVNNEERYRARIDALEDQLESEKAKRVQLEESLEMLLVSTHSIATTAEVYSRVNKKKNNDALVSTPRHQQSLKAVEGQDKILQHTIDGLGILGGETDNDHDDDTSTLPTDQYETFSDIPLAPNTSGGSFAAVEQLSQGLKAAKTEMETLRVSYIRPLYVCACTCV